VLFRQNTRQSDTFTGISDCSKFGRLETNRTHSDRNFAVATIVNFEAVVDFVVTNRALLEFAFFAQLHVDYGRNCRLCEMGRIQKLKDRSS